MKKALLLICSVITMQAYSQDIAITQINSPDSGCNVSCLLPNIIIYNNTGAPLWNGEYLVCYSVNGGTQICDTLATSLSTGATWNFNFDDTLCFPTHGTYIVQFSIDIIQYPLAPYNGPDINLSNNTKSIVIVNDTTVIPGTLSMSDSVCVNANSGTLTLAGNTGYIHHWESSTGGGPWVNEGGLGSTTHTYSNLAQTTTYRVFLDGGLCPDDYSQWAIITTVNPPVGGTAIGNASVCATANAGTINLSGQTGNVSYWGFSNNASAPLPWPAYTPGANNVPMNYTNLTNDTWFYASVSNGGYCPDSASSLVHISVTPSSNGGIVNSDATVCMGDSDTLELVGSVGNILQWVITTGSNSVLASGGTLFPYSNISTTTQYYAIVQNGMCPSDTSTVATITVMPAPSVFAGLDTTISLGNTVCFNATGALIYSWSPAANLTNPGLPNPCFTPATPGSYTFTVEGQDAFGCSNTDQIVVRVADTVTIFPPVVCNFVTPNGDGLNDVWNIMNIHQYPDNEVTVYNNHGQPVFSKSSYTNDWKGTYEGKQLPDGAYYYVVKINAADRVFHGILNITDTRF